MSGPFGKTTFGPPAPTGVDTDKGYLIADVQNGVLDFVDTLGNCHGIETMLALLLAQTALTNVTTAQNLFSKALPANALSKLGRTILITGTAIFTTANAATITIAIVIGGVTVCTVTTATTAAAITNGQIQFTFTISTNALGAAGNVEAHGSISAQLAAALGTALPFYADQNTAVSGAINLTQPANLVATIACSAAVASVQLRQCSIEIIN